MPAAPSIITVAAGILFDTERKHVLLARRLPSQHQGGFWEFPGGKLEAGETPQQALERELLEELDLQVLAMRDRADWRHDYGDKHVHLHFIDVSDWRGEPKGLQGQELRWFAIAGLQTSMFPPANRPLIALLKAESGCN